VLVLGCRRLVIGNVITGIERWDFAIVARPEVVTLVLRVLRRGPVVFVWVICVHYGLSCARKYV
jgi:hypothetical protein